MYKYKSLIKMF